MAALRCVLRNKQAVACLLASRRRCYWIVIAQNTKERRLVLQWLLPRGDLKLPKWRGPSLKPAKKVLGGLRVCAGLLKSGSKKLK